MKVMAEGVNGLLRRRRESFVVCALRTLEASERRARGLGGLAIEVGGVEGDWRVLWKVRMRVVVEEMVVRRVWKLLWALDGGMVAVCCAVGCGRLCELAEFGIK